MIARFENYNEKNSKLLDDKDSENTKFNRALKGFNSTCIYPEVKTRLNALIFVFLELWKYFEWIIKQ